MKSVILRCLAIILLATATALAAWGNNSQRQLSQKELYNILDKALSSKTSRAFILHRIDSLLNDAKTNSNPRARFETEMRLAHSYTAQSLDSAILHANRALKIAEKLPDNQLLVSRATMQLASLYNTSGAMMNEALNIFQALDGNLPDSLKQDYFVLGVQIYRDLANSAIDPNIQKRYNNIKYQLRDSAIAYNADNKMLIVFKLIEDGNYREALRQMGDVPDTLRHRHDAITYNILSQIYEGMGDYDKTKHYLTLSAICDISNGVREYSSLQKLAKMLYAEGDIDRAHRYIQRSINDATAANAKQRMLEMSEIVPVIDESYDELQSKSRRYAIVACAIFVLLAVITLGLFLLARQRNQFLKESYRVQQQLNSKLLSTSSVKDEYVKRFMNLSLEYLARMDSYRLKLKKVAMARNFDKLAEAIASTGYINDELEDFLTRFDEAFIQLYPDFIDKINDLLCDDKQIHLNADNSMSTELRIFAIMRLGITDSAGISKFLNCSASTIYNYRTRMRNRAKDREAFDKWIANGLQ